MLKTVLLTFLLSASLQAQIAVINAASFSTNKGVSPGSYAAAFGTFTGVTTTTAALPFPKVLAGVKVTVDGVDAPLYDVRSTQITFLIPTSVTPGVKTIVVMNGAVTTTGTVKIIGSAPGLFVKDAANPPKGAILNQNGLENSSALPARKGEVISIYGTGPGAFAQPVTDGVAPGSTPLITTKSTPQVYIGGVPAEVQFSGLNPSSPGLWQVNVFVPNQPFLTGRVPLQIFVDGVDSNEVGVFVQ